MPRGQVRWARSLSLESPLVKRSIASRSAYAFERMQSSQHKALSDLLRSARLPMSLLDTTDELHVPLAAQIAGRAADRVPLIVGLCGSQGSGKSTMASILSILLEARGWKTVAVSLDDFYRPRGEREQLAAEVHPLLITRGVPGTHDVTLAMRTLDALREVGTVDMPRFDKATDDRLPHSEWMRVAAPVDILLFEGWCVGARPQRDEQLIEPINELERERDPDGRWRSYVNEQLATEYAQLFERIDLQILLRTPRFDVVYEWRAEQELKLRKRLEEDKSNASRTMTAEELRFFIAHFERLTRHILEEMPARSDVVIALDEHRRATNVSGMDRGAKR